MVEKVNRIKEWVIKGFEKDTYNVDVRTDIDVSRLTVTFIIHNLTHKKYLTIPFRFSEIENTEEKEIFIEIMCKAMYIMLTYESYRRDKNESN